MPHLTFHVTLLCLLLSLSCCNCLYDRGRRSEGLYPENREFVHKHRELDNARHDVHGGVPMGVKNIACDDTVHGIEVDWDGDSIEYECRRESFAVCRECPPIITCNKTMHDPKHKCLRDPVVYFDKPPLGGPHRPNWPIYGEYKYCPPQRWVHVLEHGAVVFLYHPCAEPKEVEKLKQVVHSCIRRHVLTPYRHLSEYYPLAIVTYGWRLEMSRVNLKTARQFVKEHALRAPERMVAREGKYSKDLLTPAPTVTDFKDSVVCPESVTDWENELKVNATLQSRDPVCSQTRE